MLVYILYPVSQFIINENTFIILSLVGSLSLIIQTCFHHFCIVRLLTLPWTKKKATHNRKMSASGKKKGCFFPSMPATKIQQLKGGITVHHSICCSPMRSCTPTSEQKKPLVRPHFILIWFFLYKFSLFIIYMFPQFFFGQFIQSLDQ